jgi:hypothetical protein
MSAFGLTTTTRQLAGRAREGIAREPKKAIACAALLVVFGAMAARSLMRSSGVATASAESSGVGTTALHDEESLRRVARDDANARAARADKLESWLSRPLQGPARDLFAFRPENYASVTRAGTGEADVAPIAAETGRPTEQPEKSNAPRADLHVQRQVRVDAVVAAAGKLRLQSTVIQSGVPRAMIDGQLVKAGDTVTGEAANGAAKPAFRVVRIDRQSVVVDRDGVRVEISMVGAEKVRLLSDDE